RSPFLELQTTIAIWRLNKFGRIRVPLMAGFRLLGRQEEDLPMEFQLLRACGSGPQDEAAVVCFTSDSVSLHTTAAIELADRLSAITERLEQPRLILDFENVDFISSSALGTLVSLHERLVAKGKCLTIDNLCPNVYEVFKVTRLDRLLHLQPADP